MFGFGGKKFLGIDIGTSNIKIVELKLGGNKPMLSNYAWIYLDGLMGDRDLKAAYFDTVLPEYMKRMVSEAGIKSKKASFSIPAFGGLITLIEFPEMAKEDLDQAIKFEAHKYIPTNLDDVVLSWDIVSKKSEASGAVQNVASPQRTQGGGKIQVLLVAAPKSKVAKYVKLAKEAKLELDSIEIESFSLVRSLVGNDQGNFMIIDIGSRVCNIILVEKGIIKANRNIDAGGTDISKAIAKSMNIDEERAEKLKVSGKNFLDGESNLDFPVLDLITAEVRRVLSAYYKDDVASKMDGVILSGGTATFPGIDEYFSKALSLKVMVGNPLGRIGYDKKLEPKIHEIREQLSVAIGLALKGIEEYKRK